MRVSVLQPAYPADTAEGSESCIAWMKEAVEKLPDEQDLVVLPEYANVPGIVDRDRMRTAALGEGARFLEWLSDRARDRACCVAVGAVVGVRGRWLNRTILYDRTGGEWYVYDKVHLTEAEESSGLAAGNVIGSTTLEDVRFGFATCFDVYFPELFAALGRLGVDLILMPSYQRSESPDRLRSLTKVRAIDCDSWVVRSSYAMPGGETGGCSMIVQPDGSVVANAGGEPGVISAEIDPLSKFVKPRSHGEPDIVHGALMASRRREDVYGNASD